MKKYNTYSATGDYYNLLLSDTKDVPRHRVKRLTYTLSICTQ